MFGWKICGNFHLLVVCLTSSYKGSTIINYASGQIVTVVNGQRLYSNEAIWSHCSWHQRLGSSKFCLTVGSPRLASLAIVTKNIRCFLISCHSRPYSSLSVTVKWGWGFLFRSGLGSRFQRTPGTPAVGASSWHRTARAVPSNADSGPGQEGCKSSPCDGWSKQKAKMCNSIWSLFLGKDD